MSVSLLTVFGFGLLIVAIGVCSVLWMVVYTSKNWNAARRIADAFRLTPLVREGNAPSAWFEGVAQGRAVAVRTLGRSHANWHMSEGPRASLVLRVAMEVAVPAPLGVSVYCATGSGVAGAFSSFFQGSGRERLSAASQSALFGFAQAGHPAGIHGLSIRLSPWRRNLRLEDRRAVSPDEIDPAVLKSARVVLIHDHPEPHIPVPKMQRLLFEMATVGYQIERSVAGK